MTPDEIQAYLSELSEADLIAGFKAARDDLEKAAEDDPNSDWHQACFAGFLTCAFEMQRRGINAETRH